MYLCVCVCVFCAHASFFFFAMIDSCFLFSLYWFCPFSF
jgi:hypothetical protein